MIRAEIQSKCFGAKQVLDPITLEVARGEVLAIEGSSGVGKSTLLRILASLDDDFDGRVEATGRMSMVFQEPRLMPWRNVGDNIRLTTRATAGAIGQMLTRVGLAGHENTYPRALSLGQARRVALARAFVVPPNILILDEPFTSLDPDRVADLLVLTRELIDSHRPATIFVTHSRHEARQLADRRAELTGQPARLVSKTGDMPQMQTA
ncbi:NitT/TauT family transport system ATP-binding protein [Paracoccus isoporae]|uniref:NitT/TauT family transport system ATP-binding protein n=1 Tax=Paracoccus isoporae TaxID=591205 RepID=A0A1G7GVY7_9RHOB|nr:ATP-binding cassette domain-containing protein [Paracoccus isoporae]SDE92348.1 NitT/TauT family transport system ATP-binding protein [Paracoccus isoporae]